MGTTSMSGWAVFFFLVGFMLLGTFLIGGVLSGIAGLVLLGISAGLFCKAKALEA